MIKTKRQQFYVVGQPGIDPQAEKFLSLVTPDESTRFAVNKFILRLKSIGVWQISDRILLFVGPSTSTALICAKTLAVASLVDSPAYSQSVGVTVDGVNDAINTNVTPSTSSFMGNNSQHVAWYCSSATPGVASSYFGSASSATLNNTSVTSSASFVWTSALSDGVNTAVSSALSAGHGFGCAIRASSTSSFLYRNSNQVATTGISNAGGLSTVPIHIGARNLSGVLGQFLNASFGFFSCGGALSVAQVTALEIANRDFQRALGRYNEAA